MINTKGSKVVLYIETCASLDDAKADFEIVKQIHRDGLLGIYDAAIISKDATGQVKIHRNELPTQYGAWSGLAVGALVGIFFPPYLVWELAGGLVAGALIGHFWGGMSGADLKEIGDRLQIALEPTNRTGLRNVDGTIAMARTSDPNSATTSSSSTSATTRFSTPARRARAGLCRLRQGRAWDGRGAQDPKRERRRDSRDARPADHDVQDQPSALIFYQVPVRRIEVRSSEQ